MRRWTVFLAVRRGLVLKELSNTIDSNLPQGMLERNDWNNGRSALKPHISINICANKLSNCEPTGFTAYYSSSFFS